MKKAVIYARFSCSSQTEQSIEGQLRVCKDYAKKNDLLIVNEYIDRAKTGTNDSRPSFQLMMRDCLKHEWDYVLVYKLDRFSRDKYDSAVHKHTLKQNGIKVISATENIPDSPEAIIFESVLEGFAQYYSAELSQKVKRGLTESYNKGQYTGGYQLYGYDVINKKLFINTFEANVVRELYTRYANGTTVQTILSDFNNRGIRNKRGKPFSIQSLYRILISPKYNGRVVYNNITYTDIYPQIIEDALWQSVNEKHKDYIVTRGRNYDYFGYILSGKIFCGLNKTTLLGATSTSHTGDKHRYYACRTKCPGMPNCPIKNIKKDLIENVVIKTLIEFLSSSNQIQTIANLVAEYNSTHNKDMTLINALKAQLNARQREADNIINAVKQGFVTTQMKESLEELEKDIMTLKYQIEQENSRNHADITAEEIVKFFATSIAENVLSNMQAQKYLIHMFIKDILVYPDKIIITFNYIPKNRKKQTKTDLKELEDSLESADTEAFSFNEGAYEFINLAPLESCTHPIQYNYFVIRAYFGVRICLNKLRC